MQNPVALDNSSRECAAKDRPLNPSDDIKTLDDEQLFQLDAAAKLNHFKWKLNNSIKHKGSVPIKVYTRNNTLTDKMVVCGKTILKGTPQEVIDIVSDPANWKSWDPLIQTVQTSPLDDTHSVACLTFSHVWPMLPRQLLHISSKYTLEDSALALGSRSIDHPDYPYDPKKIVRTALYGGGWHVKPVPDTDTVEVTYLMNADIQVPLVPGWMVGWATQRFPAIILKVEAQLKERLSHRIKGKGQTAPACLAQGCNKGQGIVLEEQECVCECLCDKWS